MIINIANVLFPRLCSSCGEILCKAELESGLCATCIEKMEVLSVGSRHCMRRDSNCYVCAVYSGRIAALLITFKRAKAPAAHRSIAHIFLPHLMFFLAEKNFSSDTLIITYPPGSKKSRLKRGYDHMGRLCRSMSRLLPGIRVLSLFRRNTSISQKSLDRETRMENMKSAVSIRKDRVSGLNVQSPVLILDDVITTGATLGKCRELLLSSGFIHVYCMALLTD